MGSGKSTIGKQLAQKLDLPFIDLDQYIEKQEGTSVKLLFDKKGELYFRKVEHLALKKLIADPLPQVISLGGGTPCYYNNMDLLQVSPHFSFYLKAGIPTLAQRLKLEKESRPLIAHLTTDQDLNEFIGKHLFERSSFYQKAKETLSIDRLNVNEVVENICSALH